MRRSVRAAGLAWAMVLALTFGPESATASYPPPTEDMDFPTVTSSRTLVTAGTTPSGATYQLHSYDSDDGLCLDAYLPGNDQTMTACGVEIPSGGSFSPIQWTNEAGDVVMAGISDSPVQQVVVKDGATTIGQLTPSPLPGTAVNYFVGSYVGGGTLSLIAQDSAGATLGNWTVPAELANVPIEVQGHCTVSGTADFSPRVYYHSTDISTVMVDAQGTCDEAAVKLTFQGSGRLSCTKGIVNNVPGQLRFTGGDADASNDLVVSVRVTMIILGPLNPSAITLDLNGAVDGSVIGTGSIDFGDSHADRCAPLLDIFLGIPPPSPKFEATFDPASVIG